MVFYRKYRPQVIDDLDSKAVRETLFSVLSKQDAIPHAFLFTGPKGLGKTSTARIVAKAVNCEKKKQEARIKNQGDKKIKAEVLNNIEPCNECEQCESITQGTNMDILEIDAASNRGIDEMRDLREKIRLSPLRAKKKVYIIDEVHMLTTEAFNALLKTLEEPPAHAMFVLCTTEPHKVPATILSRCFHIQFKLANEEEIVRSIKRIVEGEKLQADNDALYMIARMAEGGFRDGAKILEELSLTARGQKITAELVDGSYKVLSIKHQASGLIGALSKRSAKEGLQIVQNLIEQGVDMKFFLLQVMDLLHHELLVKVGIQEQEEKNKLDLSLEEIKVLFELFSRAYAEMKTAVLPQLPLELAIVEYTAEDVQNDSDKDKIGLNNDKPAYAKATVGEVTVAKLRKQAGTITKIKALYGSPKVNNPEDVKKTADVSIGLMHVNANGEVTSEWIAAFWRSIISEMKQHNHTVAGVLRGCSIKNYDKKLLVIEAAYKFHKERLDAPKVRGVLRDICKTLTGNDMEIEVELRKT